MKPPSAELKRISRELGSERPVSAADLLSGSGKYDAALRALLDYCVGRPELARIMGEFDATRATLEAIYQILLVSGAGQWAGGHFVAASALAYPDTLRFILRNRAGGLSHLAQMFALVEHFERGAPLPQHPEPPQAPSLTAQKSVEQAQMQRWAVQPPWTACPLPERDMTLYLSFAERSAAYVAEFLSFFMHALGDPRKLGSPELVNTQDLTLAVTRHLTPLLVEFIHIAVMGDPNGQLGPAGRAVNFRRRFLCRARPGPLAELQSQFEYILVAGIATHHALWTHPARGEFSRVNIMELQKEWMVKSLAADARMRAYDRDRRKVPSALAAALFRDRVEPMLRGPLRVRWWKRGGAQSFVRNMYFAGVLLALMTDLRASEATQR